MKRESLATNQKALQVNLDPAPYGTFAEIGAGQEVARWFFRVGGASATIAKTMSAYDMTVSDAIYGPTERYVSRQRLHKMLEHEFGLLHERLAPQRGPQTRFFAFANTVVTRSRGRSEEAHGWMGLRFQAEPQAAPSEIIVHVRMLDRESVAQQEALGIAGVNLIHAALYHAGEPDSVLTCLIANLTRDRIEVDLVRFDGPAFPQVDNRWVSLQLVRHELTDAAMFGSHGDVLQAADVLYKKPVLVVRGSFRPITNATLDLLECARAQFGREPQLEGEIPVVLTEMTLRHLAEGGSIDQRDFLDRADTLAALGLNVLVSNYARYFRLAAYLLRQTSRPVGLALGVRRLRELFDDQYYADIDGGVLEAVGRMFKRGLKVYAYPVVEGPEVKFITARNLEVVPEARHLYAHLLENRRIEDLTGYQEEHLRVFARDVLGSIRSGDGRWESLVPPEVVRIIRERRLFGYPGLTPS
jgi:hypothetical protein